jgi:predicted PurR-regulated permease PerM
VSEPAAASRRPAWSWLLLAALAAGVIYLLRDALWPFLAGMAVAYLLDPLADRLEARRVPRGAAAALIVLAFFIAFLSALLFLVPLLVAQAVDLLTRIPDFVEQLRAAVRPLVADVLARLSTSQLERIDTLVSQQAGKAVSWIGDLASVVVGGGVAVVNIVSLLVIMPVVAFYLIRDWDHIVATVGSLLPRDWIEPAHELIGEVNKRLSGFIRGQASVCLILGIWNAVGLSLVGLSFGLVVGLTAGFVSFIPYLGTVIGLGLGLGLAFAQFDSWQPIAMVGGVFAVSQILEGWVLTPNLVGDRVGLHPAWLLFALMAGGTLLGFTGVLLAVPVAAVIGVFVRFAVTRYRGSTLYRGAAVAVAGDPPAEGPPAAP